MLRLVVTLFFDSATRDRVCSIKLIIQFFTHKIAHSLLLMVYRLFDVFKRTTISFRNEEYEALRFIAFKRRKSIAAVVGELIYERLEEKDIRDCMKALAEESDTMDWDTFKKDYLDTQD